MYRHRPIHGFTLVEVLVVVFIIGLLASVMYANFGDTRAEARNRAMQVEIKELQLALELFKAERNAYPINQAALSLLVPDYMPSLPEASDSANPNCTLTYDSDGTWYKYTAARCHAGAESAAEGIQPDDELARCLSTCSSCATDTYNAAYLIDPDFYESYAVYSFGGECQ